MFSTRSLTWYAVSFVFLASTAWPQPALNRPAPQSSAMAAQGGAKALPAGRVLAQGDILVPETRAGSRMSGMRPQSVGTAYAQYLWPKVAGVATVYYAIDAASDPNATAKIQAAIDTSNADFSGVLQWVPWQSSYGPNYVDINLSASDTSGECEAAEGYEAVPAQPMTGSTNCTVGTILHEMGHVIGLWHEQSRSDRDSYITLNYGNVIKGSWGNYDIVTDNQQILGLYDYASAMQYPAYSFSRNGGPVIETIPAGMPLANVDGVPAPASADYSAGDKETIERLYGAAPKQVTITSNPVGLTVEVDGTPITTPQTFNWTMNSTHTLDVPSGVQTLTGDITASTTSATFYYTYGRWNDSYLPSHTITVTPGSGSSQFPSTAPQVATYSANFIQLVPYTSAVYPAITGTVSVSPQPLTYTGVSGQYFVARQQATLTATPVSGWNFYEFNNAPFWLPGGLGANPKTFYVPDTGNPVDTTAEFSNAPIYTVDVSPDAFSSNLYAYVDGDFWYLPKNFSPYMYYDTAWTAGSSHTLNLDSPEYPYSVNSRYAFSSWSDGGAQSHSIASLPAASTSYVATLAPQFAPVALSDASSSNCGTVSLSPNSPTSDGFYPAGQQLTFTANAPQPASVDWFFVGWTDDLTGANSPAALTANDETLVEGHFNNGGAPLTLTGLIPSSTAAGGPGITLTIKGNGFNYSGPVVMINGSFVSKGPGGVQVIDANTLQVPVSASLLASPGALQITVYLSNSPPIYQYCSASASQTFLVTGASPVSLTSTANPSILGNPVTFTATVSSTGATPTGTITFSDGSTVLATQSLNASASASYTTSTLTGGVHDITAAYGGDSSHSASTSAVLTQTVSTSPVFSFSPTSLTFPSTALNTQSASQVLTLTNNGVSAGTIDYYYFSGNSNSEFLLVSKTCGTTLAAGASCTLSIAFKPTVLGSDSEALNVQDNAQGGTQSVPLSGTGGTQATFTFSPASLVFPSTFVGGTSSAQVLTLTNTGGSTATVSSYAFSGSNASEFSLSSKTCGGSIAGGASCTLSVVFKPTVAGAASANLVATDTATGSPQSVPLSGTGSTQPVLVFAPTSLTFATTTVGGTAPAQVLTVKNASPFAMTVSSYKFTGTNASEFSIQSKTCVSSLAANSACTITILFKPTVAGAASASLAATDNASGSPQSEPLIATGLPQPTATFSPTSLTFPSTNLGGTSAGQVLTFSNTSSSPMTVHSYTFTGTNASEFFIQSKTCGSSLAANGSCTLTIVFKPTVTGAASANLAATDNAVGSPQTVPLTGTVGAPPTVSFSPSSLIFPSTSLGKTSASQVLTVSNTSSSPMTVNSYAFTGANAGEFTIVTKTCGGSLAANTSCTLTLAFKPTATGAATASLTATDNAAGSPQSVGLSGTGQ